MGIFPRNSPKVGVGTGKTFLGKIGDQLGTGTNLLLGNFGEFSPKIPQKPGWGWGRHFWGILGTHWGQGQNCYRGILGNFPRKFLKNQIGDGEDIFGDMPHSSYYITQSKMLLLPLLVMRQTLPWEQSWNNKSRINGSH